MSDDPSASDLPEDAFAWVVRLHGDDAGEADWLAFDAWISAAPGRRDAYDEAAALWRGLDPQGDALARSGAWKLQPARARPARRAPAAWPIAAALAGLAVVAGAGLWLRPVTADYEAPAGETRAVTLADGSRVTLNARSHVRVSFGRLTRRVTLERGEAAFDVVKDARRPFLVAVADRQVRVVGTEFDILRSADAVKVTVRRGVVEVKAAASNGGEAPSRLLPGQQLVHRTGATDSTIVRVAADDAFAWRQGYLVYHDRPLAEVIADLNRRFAAPIRIDAAAGALRFSGVLQLDSEDAVVARLAALMSIDSRRTASGYDLTSRA